MVCGDLDTPTRLLSTVASYDIQLFNLSHTDFRGRARRRRPRFLANQSNDGAIPTLTMPESRKSTVAYWPMSITYIIRARARLTTPCRRSRGILYACVFALTVSTRGCLVSGCSLALHCSTGAVAGTDLLPPVRSGSSVRGAGVGADRPAVGSTRWQSSPNRGCCTSPLVTMFIPTILATPTSFRPR